KHLDKREAALALLALEAEARWCKAGLVMANQAKHFGSFPTWRYPIFRGPQDDEPCLIHFEHCRQIPGIQFPKGRFIVAAHSQIPAAGLPSANRHLRRSRL